MVFGIISLAATVPLIATSTLSLQDQAQNTKSEVSQSRWKTEKSHLHARASARSPEAHKALFPPVSLSSHSTSSRVVLYEGKLYIDARRANGADRTDNYHPFTGYFLAYPNANFDGLASTISKDPPLLNWIYLDSSSLRMQHGVRAKAEQGITGPFNLVEVAGKEGQMERRLSFEGWEGFLAIETKETAQTGLWELGFDRWDDGLKGRIDDSLRVVELELVWKGIEDDRQFDGSVD